MLGGATQEVDGEAAIVANGVAGGGRQIGAEQRGEAGCEGMVE